MAFEKYLAELQEMIAKFLDIHANPYDTSKHNETAEKLAKVQEALAKAKTTDTTPTPKNTKPTNELGLTEEQVTEKLTKFLETFDKITVTVDGKPVQVEVPYFINYKGKSHGAWDGATETAGKGTPAELRAWLQKEIDGGKTKAKDAAGLNAYMKAKEMGVDCSGFVSQALNYVADKEGDMDYGKDDAFAPDSTGSGSLKGGAKDFKAIAPADVKAGDTLFYNNVEGVDHIQIVANVKKEGEVVYYTIFESAGGGPRKMDWKYEGGQLYQKNGDKWTKKTNQSFGRWVKLEMKVPTGGEVVTDGGDQNPVAAKTISDTVGEGGKNNKADVLLVQELLNKNGASLTVDGDCGKKSIAAIKAFQTKIGMANPDGLISPGKNTWNALSSGTTVTTPVTNTPVDTPVANDTPQVGKIPSNFVRMKDNEVTPELSKAAVHYLNVFTKKYPAADRNKHYGEYIIFKTQDGKEFLAHFEVHEVYGADPKKPKTPHPSIGLFKNVNNGQVQTGGGIIDTITDAVDDVVDGVVDFVTDIITGGTSIKASVGEGGKNDLNDVKIVQDLLNKNGASLTVDGDCGKKSITAIKAFQTKIGMSKPDGLVSPGGKTWQALAGATVPVDTPVDNTTTTPVNTTPTTGGTVDPAFGTTSKITASVGNKGVNKPEDVVLVKKLLNAFGNKFELTPTADNALTEAIKKFQKDFRGSTSPDGKIDPGGGTWNSLLGIGRIKGDILKVAKEYGVEPAVILAIQSIESGGNGFLADGRPKILFEGHVFWSQLKAIGKDPVALQKGNENIIYPKWVKTHYVGGAGEYDRLEQAKKIDKIAALKSASWGEFQIMGFNHGVAGYPDVESFVTGMHQAGANQLSGLMGFLKNNKLLVHVQGPKKNWEALAKGYNGGGYKENQYDTKLAAAYERFSKITL